MEGQCSRQHNSAALRYVTTRQQRHDYDNDNNNDYDNNNNNHSNNNSDGSSNQTTTPRRDTDNVGYDDDNIEQWSLTG